MQRLAYFANITNLAAVRSRSQPLAYRTNKANNQPLGNHASLKRTWFAVWLLTSTGEYNMKKLIVVILILWLFWGISGRISHDAAMMALGAVIAGIPLLIVVVVLAWLLMRSMGHLASKEPTQISYHYDNRNYSDSRSYTAVTETNYNGYLPTEDSRPDARPMLSAGGW